MPGDNNTHSGHHFNEQARLLDMLRQYDFVVTNGELAKALGYPDCEKAIIRHTSSSGKSGLNVGPLLMDPTKSPEFDQFSTVSNHRQKEIIICNPLLKLHALKPGDAAFLFAELIKQAVQNGKPIILDELNLFDPQESGQIEFFLNTILSNKQIHCQPKVIKEIKKQQTTPSEKNEDYQMIKKQKIEINN